MNIKVTYKDGTTANGEEISHYPSAVVEADSIANESNVEYVEIIKASGEVVYSVDGVWRN